MSSIRTRSFSLTLLGIVLVGAFAHQTYTSQTQFFQWQKDLIQSQALAKKVATLPQKSFEQSLFQDLQNSRKQLTPPEREIALSNVIQSYSAQTPGILKKRVDLFVENEETYQSFLLSKMNFADSQIFYYGGLTLGMALLALIFNFTYLQVSIFSSLHNISRKMVDFLNQKYSYQFEVPEPNEIGQLQATFNSLAQRVIQNMEELKSLDKAKSEFLSIASHELRTPLTSIKGSLSLLNTGLVGHFNERATNLIRIAETETDRLIRLINDLLDLAKIEARRFPLKCDWFPLEELVQQTFLGLEGLSRTSQVSLVVGQCEPIAVHADHDRIQQVLTNLLSNAIKFSPAGKKVTVNFTVDANNQVRIEVVDQGKGISPEDQQMLFQQFRQITSPENPLVKGTGLGLAIAKALVEEHDGLIGVFSEPGKGCTFYFTLPQWRYQQAKAEPRAA